MQFLEYETWPQAREQLRDDLLALDRSGSWIFRGQSSAEWPLCSAFDRAFPELSSKERHDYSSLLLAEFKSSARTVSEEWRREPSDAEWMELAQHHGLPTRLLDWSESEYVAAYFAFDTSFRNPESRWVALWALNVRRLRGDGLEIIEPSGFQNERVRQQMGKFSILRDGHASIEEYLINVQAEGALVQVLLPSSEAPRALADLSNMSISARTMFPGLDGAARSALAKLRIGESRRT